MAPQLIRHRQRPPFGGVVRSGQTIVPNLRKDQGDLPVLSSPPSISGTVNIGQTLTATPGVWQNADTITGQWYNGSTPIPGETGLTYVIAAPNHQGQLRYREEACNADGCRTSFSNTLAWPLTHRLDVGDVTTTLRGYRPPDNPNSQAGDLSPTTVAGQRVWQLTVSTTTDICQLQLGVGGAAKPSGLQRVEWVPQEYAGPGAVMEWSWPNSRYEVVDAGLQAHITALLGQRELIQLNEQYDAPVGYTVLILTDPIGEANQNQVDTQIINGELGSQYTLTFTSTGGGAPVVVQGTITGQSVFFVVTADLTSLGDGVITCECVLNNQYGTGLPTSDDAIKDTAPGVAPVFIDQALTAGMSTDGTTLAQITPAGIQVGDLLVATIGWRSLGDGIVGPEIQGTPGWALDRMETQSATVEVGVAVYSKIATADDTSAPSYQWSSPNGSCRMQGNMFVIRNAGSVAQIQENNSPGNTAVTLAPITTSAPCQLLCFVSIIGNRNENEPTSGNFDGFSGQTSGGGGGHSSYIAWSERPTAGPQTALPAWTAGSGSASWRTVAIEAS